MLKIFMRSFIKERILCECGINMMRFKELWLFLMTNWCKIIFMKFSDRYKDFLSYARRNCLFGKDSKIIVALSGGADSMVLLHFLYNAYTDGHISAIHAFHLNHSLRKEADDEEMFVKDYCHKRNIPVTTRKAEISLYAKNNHISEETAGRVVRYESLRSLKETLGYDLIATAHHADDNAETVIMRLIRGTAIKGMGGISPKNEDVIRPCLFLTKDEIYDIAESEKIPFVTDMSNFENIYFRNRVRNNIIPLLTEENPSFSKGLLRTTEIMRDAWEYINDVTDSIAVYKSDDEVYCNYCDIKNTGEFILSNLVLKMCDMLTDADNIGYLQIRKLTALIMKSGTERWEYHLTGIKFSFGDGRLSARLNSSEKNQTDYLYEIIPGENYEFEVPGIKIFTKILKKDENFIINSYIKAVDYDKIKGSLFISPRKKEQKFRPVGRNMTKSVSKFLSENKVPMDIRNIMPVFTDEEGIVLIGNMEIDERVKITKDTKYILQIQTEFTKEKI